MFSILIVIIYLAFISLGLPDSLLGSGWPQMHLSMGVPVAFGGALSMLIAGGTIVSSLLSERLTKKWGTARLTAFSVLTTAAALFGFSISGSFWQLCLWAIPYGLGAGAIDAALNNYVATHYSSRHMNWLHSFWGVGASISPFIMSHFLTRGMEWTWGYRSVGLIKIGIAALLFLSLPLWKKNQAAATDESVAQPMKLSEILKIRGVKYVLIAFFGYCALEATAGFWATSYFVNVRGYSPEAVARYAAYFYLGITFGRFLCGFVADKVGDRKLIQFGLLVIGLGIATILFQFGSSMISLAGLLIIGFGCAPIYPAIIHSTPANFGPENSQAIIGVQMASAYTGSTFMPPLFGLIANLTTFSLYPFYLLILLILIWLSMFKLNQIKNA
jgi:fucose permease